MSKFSDYKASFIDTQATLLGKMNAIIKFLEENETGTKFYEHKLVFTKQGSANIIVTFLCTRKEPFVQETSPSYILLNQIVANHGFMQNGIFKNDFLLMVGNTFTLYRENSSGEHTYDLSQYDYTDTVTEI